MSYFDWLCEKIKAADHTSYQYLLYFLSRREFAVDPEIHFDENRIADAYELRRSYFSDPVHDMEYALDKPSMLEILVSLAERIDLDILYDPEEASKRPYYFWKMCENLGLLDYPDERYDEEMCGAIADRLINRTYDSDGNGGLFPLEHPLEDQRKVEIWRQMQCYLIEQDDDSFDLL